MKIHRDFSLKPYNTFGVEAKASCFAEARSEKEIILFLRDHLPGLPHPLLILGGGSNVLFTGDYGGTVLKISTSGKEIVEETDEHILLQAQAGENWEQLVDFCVEQGWGGLENLALIPGNAGSSPIQNIGAYGAEMKDCFESLQALALDDLQIRTFNKEECCFGYRSSVFKHELKGQYIILSVTFRLSKNSVPLISYAALSAELQHAGIDKPTISDVAETVKKIRRSKLPDPAETGNAGSFFKNPVVTAFEFYRLRKEFPDIAHFNQYDGTFKLAAGWLIEQCGWKGFRRGDAGVHSRQALILVNYGNASGMEILDLSREIQQSIKAKFRVELEPEVNIQ